MPQQAINTIYPVFTVALGIVILLAFFIAIRDLLKDRAERKKKEEHESTMNWVTLELSLPTENLKSPQAMEQVFASLHAIPVEDWMSFEIVGFSDKTHFYVRIPEGLTKLVESSIFSQYPNCGIVPAEDYVSKFGTDLPDDSYDLTGSELSLSRDNAYPIRTYPSFDESRKDEYYIDPIATIVEVMSSVKNDEMIWLQIVLRPLSDPDKAKKWDKDTQKVLDELLGRKEKVKPKKFIDYVGALFQFLIVDLITALSKHPTWEAKKVEKGPGKSFSPGESDVIKAIENKRSKFAFESTIRAIYVDRRSTFVKSNLAAVVGALRQFGAPQLNSFKLEDTDGKDLFKAYSGRKLSSKPIILCVEELATLYHPPHSIIGAGKLNISDMKTGSAPTNLPEVTE